VTRNSLLVCKRIITHTAERGFAMTLEKQFDEFWELKCPHCGKKLDLEVILNSHTKK
jgi:hypothetical protein